MSAANRRGPQIFLSRTHPQFMAKLFTQEVPEIYDGIIEVKSVAPRSGQPRQDRRLVARFLDRPGRPPASACAAAASRPSSANCRAEKIDIIPWSMDNATFNRQRLAAGRGRQRVVLDEDAERIEVVVPDEQLSLAIGRRGQNVRLASQLTGWDIDIMTEQEESERRQKEFADRTQLFMDALNVDEVVGQLLASEGFSSVEEVAFVETDEVASVEGFR